MVRTGAMGRMESMVREELMAARTGDKIALLVAVPQILDLT